MRVLPHVHLTMSSRFLWSALVLVLMWGRAFGQESYFPDIKAASEEGQEANPSGSWKQVGRPGVRVVLLEDQPDLRSLTLRALRQMGLEVQAFANLAEARSGFTEYEGVPDLFITDVALTDGNGLDLAEELDADGRLSKVIIVTGNADFDRVDKLTSTRGWQLLTKPYELRELNESVVSAVSP